MITLNEEQRKLLLKNLYVSNKGVISFDQIHNLYKDIMIISANCGRGKTYYSLSTGENGLLATINRHRNKINLLDFNQKDIEPYEVLFLTSRKAIKEQQLKQLNGIRATIEDFKNCYNFDTNRERILIATAHQFGAWVRDGAVEVPPKVIILDEFHSIITETTFAEDLLYTIEYIKEHYNEIIKIALTATPQFLFNYLEDNQLTFKVIDKDLGSKYKVKNISVSTGGQAETVLKGFKPKVSKEHKVIYYTQSAKKCFELASLWGSSADFLISDYNETEIDGKKLVDIMAERGTKQYILENEELPAGTEIIFINSACREGFNIKDTAVKTIICDAVDMITIEQVLGRIRGDLENFMIVSNFNYLERNKNKIKEFVDFQNLLTNCGNAEQMKEEMILRYGKQSENKNLLKIVYRYKGTYRINTYVKNYLQYIDESYIQLKNWKNENNNEPYTVYDSSASVEEQLSTFGTNDSMRTIGNYISSRGTRHLLTNKEYFEQLKRYTDDNISFSFSAIENAIKTNHCYVLDKFQEIEKEWLDKPLSADDKKKLCAELGAVRSGGRVASWNTIKKLLLEHGYRLEEKRTSKARYTIIEK